MAMRFREPMLGCARYASLLMLPLVGACWKPPKATIEQSQHGLIYLLPGVEGGSWSLKYAHDALREGGVDAEIRAFNWNRPFNTLGNLTDEPGNRKKALKLADEITEFQQAHADAPVDIVGYSGGGGLAVFVAEALPPHVRLRHLVLVQAALSPTYDLSRAMAHVDGELHNFYAPYDVWTLGAGTTIFGTMDRKHEVSAGQSGFVAENALPDPVQRERLQQHEWTWGEWSTGHTGLHLGCLTHGWNKANIAPLLAPHTDASTEPSPEAAATAAEQSKSQAKPPLLPEDETTP